MATNPTPNSKPAIYLQDMNEVRKVFDRFDANSDGKISAEELRGVLNALGSDTSPEEVARMMEEIDTDKDGHINLDEFAAFCNGNSDPYQSAEKELKEAFELYDQDHDGKISAEELHKILTRLGEHCSVNDCAGMIKSVDSDGDGYVCFSEFRKMMTNHKQ
ncbi:Calmodulin and related proteins (EF-Hand superfamily) [Handroanthus impetiginosus]|uniref:Calmodulin and related proteins (EF-Hand superfamily) n=1 Tax=Handroanthus impetiginosus TaxID=429701 RepID=A0A2G9I1M3_9LAMI|nr:Calmodulin and related proteins (EF-Hand superfamily) [Handroanthus impetiginosus]